MVKYSNGLWSVVFEGERAEEAADAWEEKLDFISRLPHLYNYEAETDGMIAEFEQKYNVKIHVE